MTTGASPEGADTDRDLVRMFLGSRDEAAFRALYRAHTPPLYRIARRLLRGNGQDAEELVQTTWIRATGGLHRFRWGSSLRTWLTGILINCSRERLRDHAAAPDAGDGGLELRGEAAARPGFAPERLDLERAIASLPDGYREVLVLHDIEGYSHREISGLLGIDEGTSKSQLSRARNAVRHRLDPERRHASSGEARRDDDQSE